MGKGNPHLRENKQPTSDCRPRVEILPNPILCTLSPKTRSAPSLFFFLPRLLTLCIIFTLSLSVSSRLFSIVFVLESMGHHS